MKQLFYVCVSIIFILTGCAEGFKKGDKGIEYKIISSNSSGKQIAYGNFFLIHLRQFYRDSKKDTTLGDSRTFGMPEVALLDSSKLPPEDFKIFKQIKIGDSIVIRIKTDSLLKGQSDSATFIKKGNYFYTTIKVLNFFKTKEQVDSAMKVVYKEKLKADSINAIAQIAKDDKIISDYLTKNNIKATKAPMGTYVEIIQQGTGPLIDTNLSVKVNYTGKNFAGKVFDSNMDPQFQHQEPLLVSDIVSGVIKGWGDGLKLLSKGAKAKFYIPSSLAYGAQGKPPAINPNEILIFDIEILDVLTKGQVMAEEEKRRKEMEAMQKKYMDSIQKAKPDTGKKK